MSAIELVPMSVDDVARAHELTVIAEQFDGVPRVLELDELVEELNVGSGTVLADDARLAIVDGRFAGWVATEHTSAIDGAVDEQVHIQGNVAPDLRGRGVGTAMLEWAVQRSRSRLADIADDRPKVIRMHVYDQIADAQSLAVGAGFGAVRWFDELSMALPDRSTSAPPAPIVGIDIVAWDDERSEEIRRVKNDAFIGHWGSTPTSTERWRQRISAPGARADLSCIAVDVETGAIIGHCWNSHFPQDAALLGRDAGWIQNLGTLRAWRGRGIASAMIARSLLAFRAAGLTHAAISVDSDNPSGASRLYRSLGFEPQYRQVAFEMSVD